jgi:predicted RNase H-like HicB family nuclease
MKNKVVIKVEWVEEDQMYLATSDDLVGLVIQEKSLDDCCKTAQEFAYDMIGEYQPEPQKNVVIDFEVLDKVG